jgi:hypothetical protein
MQLLVKAIGDHVTAPFWRQNGAPGGGGLRLPERAEFSHTGLGIVREAWWSFGPLLKLFSLLDHR